MARVLGLKPRLHGSEPRVLSLDDSRLWYPCWESNPGLELRTLFDNPYQRYMAGTPGLAPGLTGSKSAFLL